MLTLQFTDGFATRICDCSNYNGINLGHVLSFPVAIRQKENREIMGVSYYFQVVSLGSSSKLTHFSALL